MNSVLNSWLLSLADPQGRQRPLPVRPLASGQIESLLHLANRHSVLPTVAHNLAALQRANRLAMVFGDAPGQAATAYAVFLSGASQRIAQLTAMSLFLQHQAVRLLRAFAAASIPAVLLKGSSFAQRLYRPASLRSFIDIDLLVPASAWSDIPPLMSSLDYAPYDTPMKYAHGYGEQGYRHRDNSGCSVEVHWNLVNSPTLRRGISVTFENLQLDAASTPTPASLLLIAAVHAAASHSFDKLQHLCDIVQIARQTAGPLDTDWLKDILPICGASLAMTTALTLAGRAFQEPRCTELLHALRLAPSFVQRNLLTPPVVLRAQTPRRRIDAWRRNLFRQKLKRRTVAFLPPAPPVEMHTAPAPAAG